MRTHALFHRMRGSILAVILTMPLFTGVGLARETAPPRIRLVGVEDTLRVYQVDEIVIERTRADRGASPVAYSDLTADDLRSLSYGQDVPMVLAAMPGTYAYSDAANGFGYSYLKIRGFDQNRLGMMVNGVPLNDPESHQVYWVDHGDILAGTGSVQVQRGVGATLFGGSSFGGSVNLVTSPLAVDPGIHLEAGYGNFTEKGLDLPMRTYRAAFASGPIRDGTTALYARYSRQSSEGYRIASGADLESFGLSGIYAGDIGNHKVDLLAGKELTHFAWDGIAPDALDDRDARRANPYAVYDNNVDNFRQVIGSLTSEIPVSESFQLTNTLYYVDGEGFFEQFRSRGKFAEYGFAPYYLPDSTVVSRTDLVRRRWLKNGYFGLLPQAVIPFYDGRLTVGAGVRRYDSDHYGEIVWTAREVRWVKRDRPVRPLDRYYQYETTKTTFEGYAQAQIPMQWGTIVTAGLQYQGHRYEWAQKSIESYRGYEFEANHDFVNPRLGFKHEFSPMAQAFGSVSFSQREPSDDEYIDGDDPESIPAFDGADQRTYGLDDPYVKPEKVIDYEIGAALTGEIWKATLGLYWLDFRDELIPIESREPVEESRLPRANAKQTAHQGMEFDGEIRPVEGLKINGNLSLSRHRFVDHEIWAYWLNDYAEGLLRLDDNRIPRSPELLANLIATYAWRDLSVAGHLQHVGKQYVEGENIESLAIDPSTVVNLSTEVDLGRALRLGRPLTLTGRVNNLFDSLYETWGYSYYGDFPARPFAFYWPGATRSYFLTLGTVF